MGITNLKRRIDMRKCWKWSVLLPYIGIMILLNTAWAVASELGPVTNIHAVSEHEINQPSQATVIEIEWSLPEGYTKDEIEGYYYQFDQSEFYEFDEFNTGALQTSQKAISHDYKNDSFNDAFIYFHIAAVALDDNDDPIIGTTENIGPFRIDTVQPQGVGVSTESVTYNQSIELSLIAESSNLEVLISNIGFVPSDSGWIPFKSKMNWIIPEGDGLKTIYVQFRDIAGNISQATTTTELISTPSVTLQSPLSGPTNQSMITVFANFSQPVTFSQNDMILDNAEIDQFTESASGNEYTIVLTPQNDGLVHLTIPENAAGGIVSSQVFEIMVDRQNPTINIESDIPLFTNTAPWSITIAINEAVIGFDESDLVVENAIINSFDELKYIATISPADQGDVTISVLSNSFTDAAGNYNADAIQLIRTYDTNPPSLKLERETTIPLGSEFDAQYSVIAIDYIDGNLTDMIDISGNVDSSKIEDYILTYSVTDRAGNSISITRTVHVEESPFDVAIHSPLNSPTNAQTIPVIITFDRAVDSFNYTQISFENVTNSVVTGSAQKYTIVLTPNTDGMIRFSIPEDYAKDNSGNGNNASEIFEITVDRKNPSVNIASDIPDYANTPCSITITIDEAVVNFDLEDIDVTNGTAQNLIPDGNTYTADISPVTQGLVTIVIPSGKFKDPADNENIESNAISYTFDSISPEITLNTSESSPTNAQSIHVEAILTEPVLEFNADKLNTVNASIAQNSFEGSYTAYSFDLIPPETPGSITVTVDSGILEDRAGNKNKNIETLTIAYEPFHYTLTVDETKAGAYLPGHVLTIPVTIRYSPGMTAIGYEFALPDTWQFVSVGGLDIPPNIKERELIEFSWIDNQIESNMISFHYTLSIPDTENSDPEHISATVKFRYADSLEETRNVSFDANLQDITASQLVDSNLYIAGEPTKIQIKIQELNESMGFNKFSAIGIAVNIPVDWTFEGAEGDGIPYTKDIDSGNLEFAWYDLKDFSPTNPIDLSYYIVSPDDATSEETITAILKYRFSNGSEQSEPLDSIVLVPKDTIQPDVSITSNIPEYSNTDAWQITITFSEPVKDFEYNDIDVVNGESTQLKTITQQVYVASISPTNQGEIVISIPAGIASDMSGLPNTQSIPYTRIYDIEPPQIILNGASPAYISVNDEYTDPGADASDNTCVTDQVSISGSVDTSTEGVYHLVYSVDDCAGNTGSVTRTVYVETFHPTLTVHTIGGAYLPDNHFVLSATMNFTKGTNTIEYVVTLPKNWQFESVWGSKIPEVNENNNQIFLGWENVSDTLDQITFVYTLIVPDSVSDDYELPVNVNYTYDNNHYTVTETVDIVKQEIFAEHTPKSNAYYNNGTVGIDVKIKLEKEANNYNNLSAVGLLVQLPDGWYYYNESNIHPSLSDVTSMQFPKKNDTDLLQFAWFDIKNNEISFTYDIKTPTVTESETITATVQYRFANGPKRCIKLNDLTFNFSHRPSIAGIAPANGETTNSGLISLTFTETVIGFEEDDLIIYNGSLKESSFTGGYTDINYSFVIENSSQGEFGFTIKESSLKDMDGLTNTVLTYSYIYDSEPTKITIMTSEPSTTHSLSIPVTVIFNEPVIGFTESDILLTNAAMDYLKGSDLTYTFNIIPEAPGEITVFIDSSAVSDHAGNKNLQSNILKLTYQPFDVIVTCDTDAGSYMPDFEYFVSIVIHFTQGMSSVGYHVTYPSDWNYDSVWGDDVPPTIHDQNNILEFSWLNMPKDRDTLSFTYALRVPANEQRESLTIPVTIKYRHGDDVEKTEDASFSAHLQKVEAKHSSPNNIFITNYALPVNVNIQLTEETSIYNKFSSIGLNVYVPDGWVFDHVKANSQSITPDVVPDSTDEAILQFAWFNINDLSNKPIDFTYYVKPLSDSEYAEITATVNYRYANGMENFVLLDTLSLRKESLIVTHSCPKKFLNQLNVTTLIEYNGKQSSLKDLKLALTIPDDWNISGIAPPAYLDNSDNIIYLDTAYKESPLEIQYTLIPVQSAQDIEISAQMTYKRSGIGSTDIALTQSAEPVTLTSIKTNQIVIQEIEGVESIAETYYYTPDQTIRIKDTISSALAITSAIITVDLPQGVTFEKASSNPEIQNNTLIFTVTSANPVTRLELWYELKCSGSGKKVIATEAKIGGQPVDITSPLLLYDNLRPEPLVNHHIAEISNVSPMELTLTFSKPINFENLPEDAFALTNATIADVITIQDKFIYQLNIMPKDGNVKIVIPENVIRDNLGTFNSFVEILSVVYDSQAPSIETIELPQATNLDMVPVTIIFSEPVEGFDLQDLVIANGTAYSLNQQDNIYTLNIQPTGQGAVSIEIKPGVLQDKAGNFFADSRIETFTYDTVPPEISDLSYSPETIDTVMPVLLTITLSEPCPTFAEHNINVSSGNIISWEIVENVVTTIIKPDSCGELTIHIVNLQDAAGNMQSNESTDLNPIHIPINCTTFCGTVKNEDGESFPEVTVDVSFPVDPIYPSTKTDDNGRYTLHLPKMDEKNYAFRLVKHNYITQTFTSESAPDDITTIHELPLQNMKRIEITTYQYTVTCSVTADSLTPSSIVTVISANSDPSNATSVATYSDSDNLYYLYFLRKPNSTIISASMGDYSAKKFIPSTDLVGNSMDLSLNMTKPVLPSENQQYIESSIIVSKEDGGNLKLQSSSGASIAEIEILPGAMNMNAEVKAETKDKRKSPFATYSQLVDINTEAAIIGELIVKIKITGDFNNILRGKNAVFWAKNHQEFIAGNVQEIPLEDILSVDQEPGFVRFKMRHLTTVAVGDTGLRDPDAGQRRCFISTLQSVTFNPTLIFLTLTFVVGFFRNCILRRK